MNLPLTPTLDGKVLTFQRVYDNKIIQLFWRIVLMEIKETYSVPSLTYKMELFCKDNENENYYKSIDDVVKCLKEKVMLYVNEEI